VVIFCWGSVQMDLIVPTDSMLLLAVMIFSHIHSPRFEPPKEVVEQARQRQQQIQQQQMQHAPAGQTYQPQQQQRRPLEEVTCYYVCVDYQRSITAVPYFFMLYDIYDVCDL